MLYTIPKGHHRPDQFILPQFHFGRTKMERWVRFDASALAPVVVDCRENWNKLFGLSYGYHQNNSLRFGWRAHGDQVEVGAYLYEQGKRREASIGRIDPGKWYPLEIHLYSDNYVSFDVDGVTKLMKWCGCKPSFGYLLNPYFGGHCPAPVNVQIEMNDPV